MENEELEPKVNTEVKTYTEEEVQKMLQAESDKRVNSALSKKEKEFNDKLKSESERIAKEASMSEEEKFKAQLQTEREAFETERAEFLRTKLEASTMKELSAQGLPADFAGFLIGTDEEVTKANVSEFKSLWDNKLQEMVDERLAGKTPKTSETNTQNNALSKEAFFKLPFKEREAMMAADSDLLKKLQ